MIVQLAIIVLATYRITNFFTDSGEGGPRQLFHWLRWKAGVRYDEGKAYGTNMVSNAMSCFWCFSMWTGTLFAVFYLLWPEGATAFALPFALSTGALVIKGYVNP